MFRSALLALALTACSSSGLGTYQVLDDDRDVSWRTTAENVDVDRWGTHLDIEVPAGATFLDLRVTGALTGMFIVLDGPTGQRCEGPHDGSTWTCRVETPEIGTWDLSLDRDDGTSTVAVEWEVGGAEQEEIVLAQRTFDRNTSMSLTLPDALGTLEAKATGDFANARIQGPDWNTLCEADTCNAHFPEPGSHTIDASANGSGELTVTWHPATLLQDTWVESGSRNIDFVVTEGTQAIAVSAPNAQQVRLMRGQFELCAGSTRCTVDQPVPGDWMVVVDTYEGQPVTAKVGAIGGTTPDVPTVPTPGQDDHGDTFETATVLDAYGTFGGSIAPGDQDVFLLTDQAQGGSRFMSAGSIDLMVELYDLDGNPIDSDDDSGAGTNFRIPVPEQAVYAVVTGYRDGQTGDYTVTFERLEFGTPDEDGDTAPVDGPSVIINEILADPGMNTGDANCDGLVDPIADEFIELVNTSNTVVDLAGWAIEDLASVRHYFDAHVLQPGERLVVYGGGTPSCALPDGHVAISSTGGLGLSNSGDEVTLRDGAGNLVDVVVYGSEAGRDQSITRLVEGDVTSPMVPHATVGATEFSPGHAFDPNPNSLTLMFNEVLADPGPLDGDANCDGYRDTVEDEFVEIVNYGTGNVHLDGLTLSDATALRHTFSSSDILGPGEAITIYGGGTPSCGDTTLQRVASTGSLAIGNTGDLLTLADGPTTIAAFAVNTAIMDQSAVRTVDGDPYADWTGHLDVADTPHSPGTQTDGAAF